ncbi:MAG TPA: LysR family transcriptional regulator [Burkholderiaceae bacterium]|nr:LysR family transcriptional regulator [Burkholderiaceae bacterium]
MDWDDLRYFLAVARSAGLTPAAQALGVSPATVSRRIDAFEQAMGMTLFLRRQTGYTLTDDGETLLAAALPVEQAMLGFARRSQDAGRPGTWAGSIRVATSDTIATHWITPMLPLFVQGHPGLQVELVTGVNTVNLSRRDADIALRMSPPTREEEGEYIALRAGAMAFAAYITVDDADAQRDWRTLPYVNWGESLAHVPMARWAASMFPGRQPVLLSNSMPVMIAAAEAGLGVTVLPESIGERMAALVRVDFACARDLWLVYHRDLRHNPRVVAMKDFLLGVVRHYEGRPAHAVV